MADCKGRKVDAGSAHHWGGQTLIEGRQGFMKKNRRFRLKSLSLLNFSAIDCFPHACINALQDMA